MRMHPFHLLVCPLLLITLIKSNLAAAPGRSAQDDGGYPWAVTLAADSIQSSSARLNAICYPNGAQTSVSFSWGTSLHPDMASTPFETLPSDTGGVNFSQTVGPLMPGEMYYFRVRYFNGYGTGAGDALSFSTATDTSARWLAVPLKLSWTNNGEGIVRFGVHSYATECEDDGLGEIELPPRPPGGALEARFVGRCLKLGVYLDLRPFRSTAQSDTYHLSVVPGGGGYPLTLSWPDLGEMYGGPVTMRTVDDSIDMLSAVRYTISDTGVTDVKIVATGPRPGRICPDITADSASAPAMGTVLLIATVFPNGLPTTAWFEYGPTASYGAKTDPQQVGDSIGGVRFQAGLSGLSGHAVYHYRAVARNMAATIFGPDKVFTSPGAAKEALPQVFTLYQNYPNPFNPSTMIRYDLPADAHVVIGIFDLLGRNVLNLSDGDESAGYKSISFDGSSLSSGIYLIRLTAGTFTETRKAVIIR